MKAGVSTVPRANVMRPRRAVPSVVRSSKCMSWFPVIPAKAGTWCLSEAKAKALGFRFRGNDEWGCASCISRPDQRRIAVRKKAIALLDRMTIRRQHRLAPGERADEHQQRRFRQMEVRHQRIDARDAVARKNE